MFTFLFDSYLDDRPIGFCPPPWVTIVAVVSLTLTLLLAIFIYLGIWLVGVAAVSTLVAFLLWLRVGYTIPLSRRALPAHILLIIGQLVHGAEQLRGGYANAVIQAFPDLIQPPNIITDASLALSFSLCASVVWLFGGALAFYHARVGGFIILLLAVWSVVFPASHFLIPLASDTAPRWIPGMLTGPLVGILSLLFLNFILNHLPGRRLS